MTVIPQTGLALFFLFFRFMARYRGYFRVIIYKIRPRRVVCRSFPCFARSAWRVFGRPEPREFSYPVMDARSACRRRRGKALDGSPPKSREMQRDTRGPWREAQRSGPSFVFVDCGVFYGGWKSSISRFGSIAWSCRCQTEWEMSPSLVQSSRSR